MSGKGGGMADRMIHICWGAPVEGREERALDVLDEGIGMCGRMQNAGLIESFDVALVVPNPHLNGYLTLRGSEEQLSAVRGDEEFRRIVFAARECMIGLRVYPGYAEQGVARQLAAFRESLAAVPQPA